MTSDERAQVKAYTHLTKAILWSIFIHLAALLSMALLIGPGLDTNASVLSRATWVAHNAAHWRIGWFPWQLTAASDLWVSVALLIYIRRLPQRTGYGWAILAVLATCFALVPDQWGEAVFISHYVDLAHSTVASDTFLQEYLAVEAWGLAATGCWGAAGYTLMAIGWMMATLQSAGGAKRHKLFTAFNTTTLVLFSITVGVTWYATQNATVDRGYPLFHWVYNLNAIAFPMLLITMAGMVCVLAYGHYARHTTIDTERHQFRAPNAPPVIGYISDYLPGLRDCFRFCIPLPIIRSDIEDVVYLNWLVPAERVRPLLPCPLVLDEQNDKAWFSILIYRHGQLGPRILGPLRKYLRSPLQCNIRAYLKTEANAHDSIYFIQNSVSDTKTALTARLLADGLPLQVPDTFTITSDQNGIKSEINTSNPQTIGLSTDIAYQNKHAPQWSEQLPYLIRQNRSIRVLTPLASVIESSIDIPIDLNTVRPAKLIHFESEALDPIIQDSDAFVFVVPAVTFQALSERVIEHL